MPISGISIVLALSLFLMSIFIGVKTNILKEGQFYSFSRFQLWLWTSVISPAFMFRWGANYPDVPQLNQTALILLGLAGGTSLVSWIVTDIRKSKGLTIKTNLTTNGFWNDILADSTGNPSMSRMQQLLFTFAYLAVYISLFFSTWPFDYPIFDNTAFYLMGISQGTYLIAKFNE
jgi:hypothetical protein